MNKGRDARMQKALESILERLEVAVNTGDDTLTVLSLAIDYRCARSILREFTDVSSHDERYDKLIETYSDVMAEVD
jgi:hypothetical protein